MTDRYFSIVFDMQKLSNDKKKAIVAQAQQAFIDGKAISAGWQTNWGMKMSKQTLIDELTEELNQAKSTYQECNSNLSKRIFETKIRAYSHALDLSNYHIHDKKEVVDINHIEKQIMNVINDFVEFVKPSREVNAFVFGMLKQKIILALQEYNLNGGWISVVDDDLPTIENKEDYLVYSTSTKVYEKVDAKKTENYD